MDLDSVIYYSLGNKPANAFFFWLHLTEMLRGIVHLQTEAVMLHCFCLFAYDFGMPSTLNE